MSAQQHLEPVSLSDLHPTQMTVSAAEVALKRAEWARLKPKAWEPLVSGGLRYIVDHHHLGQALWQEQVASVWVMQLADFSAMEMGMF